MEKLASFVKSQPVIAPAIIATAIVFAYHNGYLNFIFSEPSKAGRSDAAAGN